MKSSLSAMLAVAVLFAANIPLQAQAAPVTIVVNGNTVNFDQPPIERAGRVFVPLRGVFERLGASVVYANGQINATGNGKNISLHIGSTQASINGQPATIDVAPFLVGARTLVPLRFVAQSLGATVNYDNGNRSVSIDNGAGGGAPPPVTITPVPAARPNFIHVTAPAAGTHVSGTFTISGQTRPRSAIEISATSGVNIGGIPVGSGTFNNTTTADSTGYFSLQVHVAPIPGGRAAVTIQSVAPNNGGKVVKQVFYPI
ncbi:MAG: copper amine oxidase N-terminal domain-containing protein [Candidatus Eremiobacteraeota bacterium]|nr:copper amine oxidase N-terminal domain-containing protein [Candidatus Eremiobacteraeota bacterium]